MVEVRVTTEWNPLEKSAALAAARKAAILTLSLAAIENYHSSTTYILLTFESILLFSRPPRSLLGEGAKRVSYIARD